MGLSFFLKTLNEFSEKLNLDDLYEKKRKLDQSKLDLFNKLLNRVHNKIKLTSRQHVDEQFCWFQVFVNSHSVLRVRFVSMKAF